MPARLWWWGAGTLLMFCVDLGFNNRIVRRLPLIKEYGFEAVRELYRTERTYRKLIQSAPSPERRAELYTQVYDRLYRLYGASAGFDPELITRYRSWFENRVVIDFACGLGRSTALLAQYAKMVYGIEASRVSLETARREFQDVENVEFRLRSDCLLPFADAAIDCVHSTDVLEHLHPEDLLIHLREVYRVLRTGGNYLFFTPGSRSGPHDSTKVFFPQGKGFRPFGLHFREYTFGELVGILQGIGYSKAIIPDLEREVLMIAEK
jgi:SAM-dependent methyltransferase